MKARTILITTVAGVLAAETLLSLTAIPVLGKWHTANTFTPPKLLLWNASASAPRGLYLLRPPNPLHTGELVVAMLPPPLAQFAAKRGYLPEGVPLLKHIAALPGQAVCRVGARVYIDNRAVARAKDRDHLGRPLPSWLGCHRLNVGEIFLLNPDIPASFDGRYFGVLPASAITARAITVWTESANSLITARDAAAELPLSAAPTPINQSPKRMPVSGLSGFGVAAAAKPCSAHCAAGATTRILSAAGQSAATRSAARYNGFVEEAARRFDIPVEWIGAVMHVESNGNAEAVSPKGAMGLMQIMPPTWTELQQRYHLGGDAFDPHDNILAGTGYLRELLDRFGPGNFLAAYHAGPSRLEAVLNGQALLGPDTLDYLQRLGQLQPEMGRMPLQSVRLSLSDWRTAVLFLSPTTNSSNAVATQDRGLDFPLGPHDGGLFVALRAQDRP